MKSLSYPSHFFPLFPAFHNLLSYNSTSSLFLFVPLIFPATSADYANTRANFTAIFTANFPAVNYLPCFLLLLLARTTKMLLPPVMVLLAPLFLVSVTSGSPLGQPVLGGQVGDSGSQQTIPQDELCMGFCRLKCMQVSGTFFAINATF